MGDARFDYVGLVQDWYDHFVKGVDNGAHEAAAGARVHDGGEPVAHLRQLAAEGSARRDVLSRQRRRCEHAIRQWPTDDGQAGEGGVGCTSPTIR